jgi:hypothetical protein
VIVLPFLSKKRDTGLSQGVIIKNREPDKTEENQEDKDAPIKACAQDLISAIHAHDVNGAAEAIRSAFEILEKQPHEEISHSEPNESEE